ncbi:MAG: hypothetical protein ACK4S4_01035 [Pyrinomonadaceae bacterium]
MKKCPTCGHISLDDDVYCPNDGSILTEKTTFPFDMPTQFVAPQRPLNPAGHSRSPSIYAMTGAAAATIVVVFAALYYFVGAAKSTEEAEAATENKPAINSRAPAVSPVPTKSNAPTVLSASTPRQELPNYPPGEGVDQPQSTGTWFVVLCSYPRDESTRADERLRFVQSRGISAPKVDTDKYPGFSRGYYSIIVGPYSKSEAIRLMKDMRSVVPDAYVRSGW